LPRLQVLTRGRQHEYEIRIGHGILYQAGNIARGCFGERAQRIALISNPKVFSIYGSAVRKSLLASGFSVSPWLIGDGERYKSVRTAERAVRFLTETHIERSDGIVALGGGVVGDLAGFAAAVYLRGVPFVPHYVHCHGMPFVPGWTVDCFSHRSLSSEGSSVEGSWVGRFSVEDYFLFPGFLLLCHSSPYCCSQGCCSWECCSWNCSLSSSQDVTLCGRYHCRCRHCWSSG